VIFELSPAHREFQRVIRRSLEALAPARTEILCKPYKEHELPEALWEAFVEPGLFRAPLPERFGGSNLGLPAFAVAIEEAARLGRAEAISFFLVPTGLPGLELRPVPPGGLHGFRRSTLLLRGARVPADFVLAGEGAGGAALLRAHQLESVFASAACCGIAEHLIEKGAPRANSCCGRPSTRSGFRKAECLAPARSRKAGGAIGCRPRNRNMSAQASGTAPAVRCTAERRAVASRAGPR